MKGVGCPTGLTVAEQMQLAADDGVDLLVVVNQNGAQNSNSTIGIVYDDVKAFLQSPPGQRWNITIIGVIWLILRLEFGCNYLQVGAVGCEGYVGYPSDQDALEKESQKWSQGHTESDTR